MKYKISIIIPVFNVEEYLDNAFQSILSQTFGFDNLEVIFVDDCSTDNSGDIIDKYADEYDNICSLHLELNSGVAGKPRNVGVEHATSEYLMFLDPDDVFTHNACEILYDKATKYNADIVGGLNTVFNSDGFKKIDSSYVYKCFTDHDEKPEIRKQKTNDILNTPNFELRIDTYKDLNSIIGMYALWTKLFKTSLIKENNIKFAEFVPAEDSIFLLSSILHAHGMVFVNDVITEYNNIRTGDNKSVSHQISKERIFERIGVYYKMYDICREMCEEELFIKHLLINKLNYFLTDQILLSKLSNNEKREILNFISPLFKECMPYKYAIDKNLKLFELIAEDIDSAILKINNIIKSMRSNNIISIIINIGDSIEDIDNCLKNIFNQKYEKLQIICLADKSNKELYSYLNSYSDDDRLIIIEKEPGKSWVYSGLESANGTYVHFINEYNYFDDSFYENILKNFKENNAEIVLCNSNNFELNNFKTLFNIKNKTSFNFTNLSSIFEVSCKISNQIYKTTFIEEYLLDMFKNEIFFEDIFCYYYYLKVTNACCLENVFCHSKDHYEYNNIINFDTEYIENFKLITDLFACSNNYNVYEETIWENIIFHLLKPFKNKEFECLERYFFNLYGLFNKYDLFHKNFHHQVELWLNLFKKQDYDYFIQFCDKL